MEAPNLFIVKNLHTRAQAYRLDQPRPAHPSPLHSLLLFHPWQYPEPALLPADAAAAARVRLFIETVGSQLTGRLFGVLRADNRQAVQEATTKLVAGLKASNALANLCPSARWGGATPL